MTLQVLLDLNNGGTMRGAVDVPAIALCRYQPASLDSKRNVRSLASSIMSRWQRDQSQRTSTRLDDEENYLIHNTKRDEMLL